MEKNPKKSRGGRDDKGRRSGKAGKAGKAGKRSQIDDPHAAREARRYAEPIPSREAIIAFLVERGELMKFQRLAQELGLESEKELDALDRRLGAMVRDGQLIRNRREGFGVAERMDPQTKVVTVAREFAMEVRILAELKPVTTQGPPDEAEPYVCVAAE